MSPVRIREAGFFCILKGGLRADIRESVKKRLDNKGVEMPFPYRTIVYKKGLKSDT